MWEKFSHWLSDAENFRLIISGFILPVVIGILAFLASNSITAWRTRKRQSLLGAAVCFSLIEEVKNGINIMEAVQNALVNTPGSSTGNLPRKSWGGMDTISDDVLERLLCIAEKKQSTRGFPIKEIRIHLKNYFDHMCPNFDNVTNAMHAGGSWQPHAQHLLVTGKYLEAAKGVLAMLEEAQKHLDNNYRKIMPR